MKKRTIALLMAAVMLFGVVTGGTIAWLSDKAETVTNTFTVGEIELKLDESKLMINENDDGTKNYTLDTAKRVQGNSYQLIPGTTYPKDPVVTITDSNVDCYLFVKFTENDAATYLEYTSALTSAAAEWTKLDGEDDVWYRVVESDAETKTWNLLSPETVEVKDSIVLEAKDDDDISMPTTSQLLVWNAYAVQKDNLTVAEAWNLVKTAN